MPRRKGAAKQLRKQNRELHHQRMMGSRLFLSQNLSVTVGPLKQQKAEPNQMCLALSVPDQRRQNYCPL
ncbi:hypothetical protein DPMN_000097 [Dreissena polymorpha]|uniref:Uncharacterized protein n=1 Tax=Dreissena polymorpha TaxID=45954 RepID=A0A9D4MF70_DREPO|nr:hypothetical protein DPMN_000097 [Dreissena polymorpha]